MSFRAFLVSALMLVAPVSANPLPSPNWPAPADRGPQLLRSVALAMHNAARHRFGVMPVRWNDALALEAMKHAEYMAATGIYGHDWTPGRRKKMGENLWRGPRGVFSYETMIRVMVEEEQYFVPGAFPANSSTGQYEAVAHYTQIVWPATTEIGCAIASSASTDYFVCRYAPTGNKDGVYLAAGGGAVVPQPNVHLAERGD